MGGHVSAGEDFDATAVRECGEELFDDRASPRVRLARDAREFEPLARRRTCPRRDVLLRRVGLQLEPARRARARRRRACATSLYHVGIYAGRTACPLDGLPAPGVARSTASRYFARGGGGRLLLSGGLPPNMAFLWLAHAHALLTPRAVESTVMGPSWDEVQSALRLRAPGRAAARGSRRAAVAVILRDGARRHRDPLHPPRRAPAGSLVGADGLPGRPRRARRRRSPGHRRARDARGDRHRSRRPARSPGRPRRDAGHGARRAHGPRHHALRVPPAASPSSRR